MAISLKWAASFDRLTATCSVAGNGMPLDRRPEPSGDNAAFCQFGIKWDGLGNSYSMQLSAEGEPVGLEDGRG